MSSDREPGQGPGRSTVDSDGQRKQSRQKGRGRRIRREQLKPREQNLQARG